MAGAGYIFGGPTGRSYEELQRQRAALEAQAARSGQKTAKNVGEGLASAAGSLANAFRMRQLNKAREAMDEGWKADYGEALYGKPPGPVQGQEGFGVLANAGQPAQAPGQISDQMLMQAMLDPRTNQRQAAGLQLLFEQRMKAKNKGPTILSQGQVAYGANGEELFKAPVARHPSIQEAQAAGFGDNVRAFLEWKARNNRAPTAPVGRAQWRPLTQVEAAERGLQSGKAYQVNDDGQVKEVGGASSSADFGNSLSGNSWRILSAEGADSSSPEYRAAWAHLAAPRTAIDPKTGQATTTTIDPGAYGFPRPTALAGNASPSGGTTAPLSAVIPAGAGTNVSRALAPMSPQARDALRESTIRTVNQINRLSDHPGLDSNLGYSSLAPNAPGGDAANAAALMDQMGGQVFIQAFEDLKGAGQITETEGRAASAAISALEAIRANRGSAAEYRRALNELAAIVRSASRKMGLTEEDMNNRITPDNPLGLKFPGGRQ